MIRVPAFITQIIGVLLSVVIGYNVALYAASTTELMTQNPDLYRVTFWPSFVFAGMSFFFAGQQPKTPVGWKGVPTFIGARIDDVAFGEGYTWAFPFLMGIIPVDCRILIREQLLKDTDEKDLPMSSDGLAMWAKFLLIFEIINPGKWLGVENAMHGIYDIAEKILRDAIADKNADDLRTSSTKSHIGETITRAMVEEADKYGIRVYEAAVPVMRPPETYEKELAKIPIEKLQRQSEGVQNEAIVAYLKQLRDEGGLEPRDAMASIQIERGKVTANRHIYSVEGSDEIAQAFARVFEAIFGRR